MGTELVSEPVSKQIKAGRGGEKSAAPRFAYRQAFEEHCPYYMAIGMSPDEFWNGDVEMAVWYRKAKKLKNDMENQRLWLQGMYFYEALCDVSPLLRAFGAKEPIKYPDKPYELMSGERQDADVEDAQDEKAVAFMNAFMAQNNKNFNNGGEKNGG